MEFALILTVFLTLLFGLLEFGEALYVFHFVSYAAREGTRYAMVRGSSCTAFSTACPTKLDGSEVQSYLKTTDVPPGIDTTKMTVTTTWPGANPGCVNPVNSPGCVVKVKVIYTYSYAIPFISGLTTTMSSTSQIVISQ